MSPSQGRIHEQPKAEPGDVVRANTKAMADPCRRDPAQFAAMFRVMDQ